MFLRQQYTADYQVIVVCQSTDGETQDFLKRTAAENPHLYYTYIPESSRYMSRKKLQITLGVKAAKHEWIILTEPNCRPSNDKWLQTMVRQCQDPNHLVLGYVALDEEPRAYAVSTASARLTMFCAVPSRPMVIAATCQT